jgi:hypothetical protein
MVGLLFKLFFRALVIILLVAGIGNYLTYLKTGQLPLNDWRGRLESWMVDLRQSFSPDQLTAEAKQTADKIASQYQQAEPAAPTKVYKWTDAEGRVHYGDKPKVANAEQVEVKIQNAMSAPAVNRSLDETDLEVASATGDSTLDKARAAAELMRQRIQAKEELE